MVIVSSGYPGGGGGVVRGFEFCMELMFIVTSSLASFKFKDVIKNCNLAFSHQQLYNQTWSLNYQNYLKYIFY